MKLKKDIFSEFSISFYIFPLFPLVASILLLFILHN